MLNIKMTSGTKKELIQRIEELTGLKSRYLSAPTFSYQIGPYTVQRDSSIMVDETEADEEILKTLADERRIEAEGTTVESKVVEAPHQSNITEIVLPESSIPHEEAAEESVEEEISEPATEEPAEATETEPEDQETEVQEEDDEEPVETETVALNISLPMEGHTGATLRNLVNMTYQKQTLINKAVGAHFHISEELVKRIADLSDEEILKALQKASIDDLNGLRFGTDWITFSGFPAGSDPDLSKTCTELAAAMNADAKKRKKIQIRDTETESEKYTFRTWLVRIGFGGAEYKTERKILLQNLSGWAAFKNKAESDAFLAKLKEKRKAAKNSASEEAAE